MSFRIRRMKFAVNVGVAVALGLSLWSCGSGTPTGPTPAGQNRLQALNDAGGSPASANVSWNCFTSAAAGILASAADCPPRRVAPQSVVVAAAVPTGPTGLTRAVNGTTVTLEWVAPTGGDPATSYAIEAGSTVGSSNIATFDTGNAQTTLTVNGVPNGTYFVRVRGRNASGVGPPSNEVSVVVGATGPGPCTPGAPTGLAGTVIGSALALTWQAPTGACPALDYGIQAGDASGRSNLAQLDTLSTSTAFVAASVPPGTYFIRVRAFGLSGAAPSAPSNEISVTIAPPPPGTVSSTWVGLVSNGDGFVFPNDPNCGVERADMTLNLNTLGTSVTGAVTFTIRVSPGGNQCDPIGRTQTTPIIGTLDGSIVSFIFLDRRGNPNPGTATLTGTRITGTISQVENGQTFVVSFSANRQS